jgi:hypothetical protein
MIKLDYVELPDRLSIITDNFTFKQIVDVTTSLWKPLPPYQEIIGHIFDGNDCERDSRLKTNNEM